MMLSTILTVWLGGWAALMASEGSPYLSCRPVEGERLGERLIAIPRDLVGVHVYEGAPRSVRVGNEEVAVDYGKSGCLFARANGELIRRLTLADGWPRVRPEVFGPEQPWGRRQELIGPGVLSRWRGWGEKGPESEVVTEVTFRGRTWRALQPAQFLQSLGKGNVEMRDRFGTWTAILKRLNEASCVEAEGPGPGQTQRYTMKDGLAGNIITHLAVADGTVWAACVDIYEPERGSWGAGGLCRYDPGRDRWQKIGEIDGHPVRWVTLLQTVGEELWVGFREGDGVDGDVIVYGMGLYPGHYRPKGTALVLACRSRGQWRSHTRALRAEGRTRHRAPQQDPVAPTERPESLAVRGGEVILFTRASSIRLSGNWEVQLDGQVSLLNRASGNWTDFDIQRDLGADHLDRLVAEMGEILVTSERGVHRWDSGEQEWRFLDPRCPLRNPALSAVTPVGDELWVGYMNQAFGVIGEQGISRYRESTGQWSHFSPETLGTGCPVKRIAAVPGGEVWVLFDQRPWLGAAAEFPYYSRETGPLASGLARYAKGKWEFPVRMPGVPESVEHERKGVDGAVQRWTERVRLADLAAVGERVFVATSAGVYMGPEPWKRILERTSEQPSFFNTGDHLQVSEDGRLLVILRLASEAKRVLGRARFLPPDGEIRFEEEEIGDDLWQFPLRGYVLHRDRQSRWGQDWAAVPSSVSDAEWVVGPFAGTEYRAVIETAAAVWYAFQGELVRIDRGGLTDWLKGQNVQP